MNKVWKAWLTVVLISATASVSHATGTYTSIDVPGAKVTAAFKINNSGEVVGFYSNDNLTYHGFVMSGGTIITIDYPGASSTFALGINGLGQVVGYYRVGGHSHGFLMDGGTFSTVDFPGAAVTSALDINDAGQIVGVYGDATGLNNMGFELSGGVYTTIHPPGTHSVGAYGIDSSGDVVGTASLMGFIYRNGVYRPRIVFPQASVTAALGVNNLKQTVGYAATTAGIIEGYALYNGAFSILKFPGAIQTEAWGINDNREIVGIYFDANSVEHGFLWTPGAN